MQPSLSHHPWASTSCYNVRACMLKKASRTEGQEFKTKIYAMHENKEQE